MIQFLLALGFSLFLNTLMTFFLLKLAHKFKWYDIVDSRKIHVGEIPRIGGVGISITFFLTVFIFYFLYCFYPLKFTYSKHIFSFLPLLIGAVVINMVGILDDFKNLRPLYKLLGQIAAALIIIFSGNHFSSFYIPFANIRIENIFIIQIVTLIWIIGVTNAVNLIDGMDGFSGTITAIISLIMGVSSLIIGNYEQALILFILFGSITGFLIYNFPPAKIFMGDSGSLFIGFILACMPLYSFNNGYSSYALILGASFLIIPILDTFAAIIRRKIKGVPFQSPDKDHLHHKLLNLGLSEKTIILLVSIVTLLSSGSALLFIIYKTNRYIYLQLLIWLIIAVLFFTISKINNKK